MEYAICTVAAAPVRKEPGHRFEMTNQLLFGETMEVLERKEEWVFIRSTFDRYEGWLTDHLITAVSETVIREDKGYVGSGIINPVTLPDQLINAPMGCSLTGFDEETRLLWHPHYKYHGTYRKMGQPFTMDHLRQICHAWINAPYLWGGKTYMGVDCSGFVQTVFKVLGIALPRDAWQQAETGEPVPDLSAAREGDLAFFHNEKGRVVHVGLVRESGSVIHASGKVRVDVLDSKGIFNRERGKHTHALHAIRRYF